jgi:hypothetical protein
LPDLLKTSFEQDTLLSKYPGEVDALVGILAILRTLEHAGHFTHAPAGLLTDASNLADILRIMKTTFNLTHSRSPGKPVKTAARRMSLGIYGFGQLDIPEGFEFGRRGSFSAT